jgi:hypothetical protein
MLPSQLEIVGVFAALGEANEVVMTVDMQTHILWCCWRNFGSGQRRLVEGRIVFGEINF